LDEGDYVEARLNLLSFRRAERLLRKTPKEGLTPTLYIVEQSTKVDDLLKATKPRFRPILRRFENILREELPAKYPRTRDIKHEVDTGDAKPINLSYYPLSKEHRDEQERQIKALIAQGLIQPSRSPWGFPVLFVSKPGGKWRMCIDYRLLNNVTVKDAYPLPRIQDCLDMIGSARCLSKFDLTQGYYQVEMQPDSIHKTAFNTRSGKYEFRAMPFGLTNAPSTFQRIMNDALREYIGKFVIVYLDDIVIFSRTEDEHEKHLARVLRTLQEHELFAKPSKCTVGVPSLEFCGHIVGNNECRPTPAKVAAILDWPQPRNVHEVRQFLGLASYYRRYVRNFAKISTPLSDLLVESDAALRKKNFRPVQWTAQCEYAFRLLKKALSSKPVLQQVDETKPFRIESDCSEWALGCVLLQLGPDGKWHPVAYDGRKLNGAELNYPIHEKELLAIKHALRTWFAYVQNGLRTTIITDHESLKYLTTTRTPSKRLARWIDEFSEFDLDIRYRKGSEAVVPDAISSRPDFLGQGPANRAWIEPKEVGLHALAGSPIDTEAPEAAPLDQDFEWEQAMVRCLTKPRDETLSSADTALLGRTPDLDQYMAEDGRLFRKVGDHLAPFDPTAFRQDFIEYYHNHYGHYSAPALEGVIKVRGWWPTMRKDVLNFARSCKKCQLAQRPKAGREEPYSQVRLTSRPFEKWAIDFVGPLPVTPNGNK
jgi:hypothetical protein